MRRLALSVSASFNSRAREGRDDVVVEPLGCVLVSIHAPARGATNGREAKERYTQVSIHAPARGATLRDAQMETMRSFQFTRPRGARLRFGFNRANRGLVSIHAPARGATATHGKTYGRRGFNSRAREGRDTARKLYYLFCGVSIHAPARGATGVSMRGWIVPCGFNSRAREGRDAPCLPFDKGIFRFNSRAREGRDTVHQEHPAYHWSFQFTRPRGARPIMAGMGEDCDEFQFTRPRGARLLASVDWLRDVRVSIHAPARGATTYAEVKEELRKVSIHAPARGATRPTRRGDPSPHVSIHAPARGATSIIFHLAFR